MSQISSAILIISVFPKTKSLSPSLGSRSNRHSKGTTKSAPRYFLPCLVIFISFVFLGRGFRLLKLQAGDRSHELMVIFPVVGFMSMQMPISTCPFESFNQKAMSLSSFPLVSDHPTSRATVGHFCDGRYRGLLGLQPKSGCFRLLAALEMGGPRARI